MPGTDPLPPGRLLVEACVTSAAEAAACESAGAGRIELCRNLAVDGLTPGRALVRQTLAAVTVPVVVLIRPLAGDARATPEQTARIVRDVAAAVDEGAHGVSVGILDRRGRVAEGAMHEVVLAAAGRPVTFHRAFDEVGDPWAGVEALVRAGVGRVLTSGGAPTAWEGRAVLRALARRDGGTGGAIEVVGAGGVRADHVRRLVTETGLRAVHARAAAIPALIRALAGA